MTDLSSGHCHMAHILSMPLSQMIAKLKLHQLSLMTILYMKDTISLQKSNSVDISLRHECWSAKLNKTRRIALHAWNRPKNYFIHKGFESWDMSENYPSVLQATQPLSIPCCLNAARGWQGILLGCSIDLQHQLRHWRGCQGIGLHLFPQTIESACQSPHSCGCSVLKVGCQCCLACATCERQMREWSRDTQISYPGVIYPHIKGFKNPRTARCTSQQSSSTCYAASGSTDVHRQSREGCGLISAQKLFWEGSCVSCLKVVVLRR